MKKTWPLLSRSPVERKGSNGSMGVSAWGLTGEGVVLHIMWENHERLPRGGRLMSGGRVCQMDKRKRMFQADGINVGARPLQKKKNKPVGGVKIIQMSDAERKFELE